MFFSISFPLFSYVPYIRPSLQLKICKGTVCFCGVEDMQKSAFFLTWVSLLTVFDSTASVLWLCGTTRIWCTRVQGSEWMAQEKREQELPSLTLLSKPVCCGVVVWLWGSGWTGLNPNDLTDEVEDFKSAVRRLWQFFPFGEFLDHPLNRLVTLKCSLCSKLGTTSCFPGEQGPFTSDLCIHLYISKCSENSLLNSC